MVGSVAMSANRKSPARWCRRGAHLGAATGAVVGLAFTTWIRAGEPRPEASSITVSLAEAFRIADEGNYPSSCLLPNGGLAIAFISSGGLMQDSLVVAEKDEDGWRRGIVFDKARLGPGVSLACDGSGQLGVAFENWANNSVEYAWRGAGDWVVETVRSGLGPPIPLGHGGRPSLLVDERGDMAIAFYDGMNGNVDWVKRSGGSWVGELVGRSWFPTAVARRRGPHIVVMYTDTAAEHQGGGRIRLARRDASGWLTEDGPATGATLWNGPLAIDGGGRCHVLFLAAIPRSRFASRRRASVRLMYAEETGSGWRVEEIWRPERVATWRMALMGDGTPLVACGDPDGGGVIIGLRADRGWAFGSVAAAGTHPINVDLCLEGNDNLHLFWRDASTGSLWHGLVMHEELGRLGATIGKRRGD